MRHTRVHWGIALSALLLAGTVMGMATLQPSSSPAAGAVRFVATEQPGLDSGARLPGASVQGFLRSHAARMLVYAPSFDRQTAWYRGGWLYQDAYAIYPGSRVALAHSRWILRDRSGRPAYIPWGCGHGSCPQYAGNIADPGFRRFFIDRARAALHGGRYRGLYVDDVNLLERVSNGSGDEVTPVDAQHHSLTASAWRATMARFMAEIRVALPRVEIVHNAIWYAGASDAAGRQEIAAADYVNIERGANDAGITDGSGPFAYSSLLSFADTVHRLGRHVILDGSSTSPAGMAYNLATYFLVSDGGDLVSSPRQGPGHWWPGFDVNLGAPRGARYAWDGLERRDFEGGMVLLDPPGGATTTVALSAPLRLAYGGIVQRMTLDATTAVILQGSAGVSSG
jgi:putative glycosyl hydrolase-like family 15 (GHL15) protein